MNNEKALSAVDELRTPTFAKEFQKPSGLHVTSAVLGGNNFKFISMIISEPLNRFISVHLLLIRESRAEQTTSVVL